MLNAAYSARGRHPMDSARAARLSHARDLTCNQAASLTTRTQDCIKPHASNFHDEAKCECHANLCPFAALTLSLISAQGCTGTSKDCNYIWHSLRGVNCLQEGDVELAWDACGAGNLVVPGAVIRRLPSLRIGHALLQHHAQPKHKRTLHLDPATILSSLLIVVVVHCAAATFQSWLHLLLMLLQGLQAIIHRPEGRHVGCLQQHLRSRE